MSWRAFDAVKEGCHMRPAAKLTQSYIAHELWDRKGGTAEITNATLQRWTGYKERYLRLIVGELIAAGELIVWYQPGNPRGNVYAIPLYPREAGYEAPAVHPCDRADGHTCNGSHSRYLVDREHIDREIGNEREKRNISETRVRDAKPTAATIQPAAAGPRRQQRPEQRSEQPTAAADTTPLPADEQSRMAAFPASRDRARPTAQPTAGPTAEPAAAEAADDLGPYPGVPGEVRHWTVAAGIRRPPADDTAPAVAGRAPASRPGTGHTRPPTQPGRSSPRRP